MTSPIVFVGDSITQQWAHCLPGTFAGGLINRGVGGETTRMIALRLRAEIESTGAEGLHLMCGLNDVAQNEGAVPLEAITANLAAMLSTARELGVRIWVGSLTPADRFPWNPAVAPGSTIAAVNAWLRSHAEAHGAVYIDYHRLLATRTGGLRGRFGTDGVHLSRTGYEAIEPAMRAALGLHASAAPPDQPLASPTARRRGTLPLLVLAVLLILGLAAAALWSRLA